MIKQIESKRIFKRSQVASQNLKKSDSNDYPDSGDQPEDGPRTLEANLWIAEEQMSRSIGC